MAATDEYKKKYTEFMLADATTQVQVQAKINEIVAVLSANGITPALTGYPTGTVIANAQAVIGASNVYDFGPDAGVNARGQVLVRISTATTGTTPGATVAIQGSNDNQTWTSLQYSDINTPTTYSTANLSYTTSQTAVKIIRAGQRYRYLQVSLSAVLNMSTTVDVYPLGD